MSPIIRSLAIAASASFIFWAATPGRANAVEAFYKDRQLSLLIGFGPGGSNDVGGRAIARHMGRHIPGKPTIVAQNMPGAGTMKLALYLMSAAPSDGSTFGLISRGIPLEPLLGDRNTAFAPLKMSWIGSPDQDTTLCVAHSDAKAKTMTDLQKVELTMGGTGSGADSVVYPEFFAQFLGMKFRTVKGYRGSNDIFLAMERREVDGICIANDALMRQSLFREGRINILFQAALKKDPKVKGDPPLVLQANDDPGKAETLEFFLVRAALGRPMAAPPGVPADRHAALQKAFMDTMNDNAFKVEATKLGLTIDPISGTELADMIKRVFATPDVTVRAVSDLLKRIGN
jgi:tripartite-type tricarboxylate transporter receptor subunit TctC